MVYARTRNMTQHAPTSGSYIMYPLFGGPPVINVRDHASYLDRECSDVVGNLSGDNPFDVSMIYRTPTCFRGQQIVQWPTPDFIYKDLIDWPSAYCVPPPDPRTKFPALTETQKNEYAMDVIARTNPSTPHISVPTFIGELKDVPDLVRGWGSDILENIAKGYLSWRWGIKPMIRDFQSMLSFQEAVANRLRWFDTLESKGVLRRKVGLGTAAVQDAPVSKAICSVGALVYALEKISYTEKVWGSTQWKLEDGYVFPETLTGRRNLAHRLTFGITGYESLNTAWELLPWSWFVDWFASVGNLIAATNNTIPVTPHRTCLMRTTTSVAKYERTPFPGESLWATISRPGWAIWERKERHVVASPAPISLSTLSLIESDKWSILAALAVLKVKKDRFFRHN